MAEESKKQATEGIRSYGPGKFNHIVDSYVYDVSGDGVDSEVGDVQDFGWYGMMTGKGLLDSVEKAAQEAKDSLTAEERELFKEDGGVILYEDSQGLVTVDYYDNKVELEKKWSEIEADAEEFYKGDEGDSNEALDVLSKGLEGLAEAIAGITDSPLCEARKHRKVKRNHRGRKGKPAPRRGKRKH